MEGFFTNEDIRNITASEGSSLRGFYKTWTRKEALLKAIGTGITERLDIGVSEPVSSGFSLNTVMFGDCYVITTATNPGSGAVKTLVK